MTRRRTPVEDTNRRLIVPAEVGRGARRIARDLRRGETESERLLWDALRARHLNGRKFRRQQTIGPFIVDFYCADERLVVEIDGSVHDSSEQIVADASRQQAIESIGVRFIRVRAELVTNDIAAVLLTIEQAFLNK